MSLYRRTHRTVDGQRVDGTWRPIFVRNADVYHLSDLIVYADGAIDAGTEGLTDLDGLARQLRSGRVATRPAEGARASAHHLATWRFTEVTSAIDAATLLAEVADDIDRLNGRPDSTGRCLLAVQAYLADPTEDNRLLVRQGYLAIPEHQRVYALGDMDARDQPLRVLATAVGDVVEGYADDEVVTAELHAEAVEYFREREPDRPRRTVLIPADGPDQPSAPTLVIFQPDTPWNPGRSRPGGNGSSAKQDRDSLFAVKANRRRAPGGSREKICFTRQDVSGFRCTP
ncbi:MAG TPA: hypothetical protein VN408_27680 [Actinoplanes sp.]|nr:hypothetical protein [Actinoplanes sp.]